MDDVDVRIPESYTTTADCLAQHLERDQSHYDGVDFLSVFKVSLAHCFVIQWRDGVHIHPCIQGWSDRDYKRDDNASGGGWVDDGDNMVMAIIYKQTCTSFTPTAEQEPKAERGVG